MGSSAGERWRATRHRSPAVLEEVHPVARSRRQSGIKLLRSCRGHLLPELRHLLSVWAVGRRRTTSGQPAHERKLAAVVDFVMQEGAPKNIADRHRLAGEEDYFAIQIRRDQLRNSCASVRVGTLVPGSQGGDCLGALESFRLYAHLELSTFDAEAR